MLSRILGANDFAVVVKLGRELHHRAPFCFVLLVCVCLSCRPRVPKWREPNRRAAVNQLNLCRLRQRSARCRHSNQGGRAGGFQEALSARLFGGSPPSAGSAAGAVSATRWLPSSVLAHAKASCPLAVQMTGVVRKKSWGEGQPFPAHCTPSNNANLDSSSMPVRRSTSPTVSKGPLL